MVNSPANRRPIRSFVRRQGRLTPGQERALEQHWPRFGVDPNARVLDLESLFQRSAPKYLEIGFGMGDSLSTMARQRPQHDFIGIDVYQPGTGKLLLQLEQFSLSNVRVICADAVEVLQHSIAPHCLDGIYIFFPDPWPKKRHHKRRLIQADFLQLLATRLNPGALLHLATDWQPYALHMLATLEQSRQFINRIGPGRFAERGDRPLSKYERRGRSLGHGVWDLRYSCQEKG